VENRSEELRREIDDVRDDLGSTLEEIGDRVAPKKVMARAKSDVADKVGEVRDKVSPTGLARRGADGVRRGVRSVMGSSGGAATSGSGGRGRALARRAADAAGSAAGSAAGRLEAAPDVVRDQQEGNPLAAGLLAFAAGFFAAALLPPTDRERQLTQKAKESLEPFAQNAADIGRQVAGELQSTAQTGLERVKETATEAAQEVKGTAEQSADDVKGKATRATKQVAGQAKEASTKVRKDARTTAGAVKGEAKKATRQVRGTAANAAKGATKRPSGGRSASGRAPRSPVASAR
jgi:ElaB/YqjD/DUF883 family membrane-anchored ribosome-binding protein